MCWGTKVDATQTFYSFPDDRLIAFEEYRARPSPRAPSSLGPRTQRVAKYFNPRL